MRGSIANINNYIQKNIFLTSILSRGNNKYKLLNGGGFELINIAHPDFRATLEKEARRMYWP